MRVEQREIDVTADTRRSTPRRAARIANAPIRPEVWSTIEMPYFVGLPPGSPVRLIIPDSAWIR